jgi:hypothetical protein
MQQRDERDHPWPKRPGGTSSGGGAVTQAAQPGQHTLWY